MINYRKIVLFIALGLSLITLFGCNKKSGWLRDRSNDYTDAECCPAIKVPADTHPQTLSQDYQIPPS